MEIHNKTPYVIVGLLFVMGFCVAASFLGAMAQFTPQDWGELAGQYASIPEQVEHLETMNDVKEGIAQDTAPAIVEKDKAALEARARLYRALGLAGVLLVAVFAGHRAYRFHYNEVAGEQERRAEAGLREVQSEKGQENPAFTPAGLLTRTTVIEGETFVLSDLTAELVPVRDGVRMAEFRDAHLRAMMLAIAAKRDVLIARAQGGRMKDEHEVILIGEGL